MLPNRHDRSDRPLEPGLRRRALGAVAPGTVLARDSTVSLAAYAQQPRADELTKGREIVGLMARSIAWYEREPGVPFPSRTCDAVFVQDFVSLGFSTPGLIMFNEQVLDHGDLRGSQYLATVISHEVAHAWIAGLVDFGAAQWLVEACATYLSRTATLELVPGSRPWELTDPPPPDAGRYAADAELIRDLEPRIGRDNVLRGLGECCRRFAHLSATPADLAACWSEISGRDLTHWAAAR